MGLVETLNSNSASATFCGLDSSTGKSTSPRVDLPTVPQEAKVWPETEREKWAEQSLRLIYGLNLDLGGRLIDFDLVPDRLKPNGIIPVPIDEAPDRLKELSNTLPTNAGSEDVEFLRAKVVAIEAVVREMKRRRHGGKSDFDRYYEDSLGIKPQGVPEEIFDAIKGELDDTLDKAGYKGKTWEEKLMGFRRTQRIRKRSGGTDGEMLALQIRTLGDRNIDILKAQGLKIPPFNYRVEFAEKNEYWKGWVDGSPNSLRLRLNTHERHKETWTFGATDRYASHELGHLIQMAIFSQEIEEGRLHPVMGLTTTPDPFQFHSEGIGQTLHLWGNFPWPLEAQISWLDTAWHTLAWQHTYQLFEKGVAAEKAAQIYREIYPLAKRKQIRDEMLRVQKNPYLRTYQDVYGPALLRFVKMFRGLDAAYRMDFLNKLMRQPMTPSQIKRFYTSLGGKPID